MFIKTVSAAAALLAVFSFVGVAGAQQSKAPVQVEVGKEKVSVDVDTKRDREADRSDKSSRGLAHRASEIQGMSVHNDAGKELGNVKDIVIDVEAGNVKYAALSYGGFLGLGDKLFAVPWEAFQHRHDTDDDKHVLVLGIDEATLKNAPGFDQSNWPDFADEKLSGAIEKHYGTRSGVRAAAERRTGQAAVDIKQDPNPVARTESKPKNDTVYRASKIIGMTVKNTADKELGSVNDLVIDMDSGDVRYVAVSFGGFLGVGDKLFAVPWDSFDCQYDPSDKSYDLVLAVDEATLRKAPGFDQDNWPDLADPKFGEDIDKYYGDARRSSN